MSAKPDKNIRVFLDYVKDTLGSKALIDVRSQKKLTGEITKPPKLKKNMTPYLAKFS